MISSTGVVSITTCLWCGDVHGAKCPLVKSIEYQSDGVTVKRVEFYAPNAPVLPPLQVQPYYAPQPWDVTCGPSRTFGGAGYTAPQSLC